MYDFIIKNALVYTGRVEAPTKTSVAVQNDRIAAIGKQLDEANAREVVDAEGLILTPGFIDPHASTGFGYFFPKAADHKLYQGITTEIFGNCGTSPGPIGPHLVPTMEKLSEELGFPFEWRTTAEYFDAIAGHLQFNIATLVGHSTLRHGHMSDWHDLTPESLKEMKAALAQAIDEGALGLSTGLIYAPGCFAELDELVQLAGVAAEKGGVYASHIRDERDRIEEAVDEALIICEKAQVDTLVSHLKAAERKNWGKIPGILRKIEAFQEAHPEIRVAVDVYPYTAVSTKLRAFIPKYILQDGIADVANKVKDQKVLQDITDHLATKGYDMSQMLIISNDLIEFCGKTVAEIARECKSTEAEAIGAVLSQNTDAWIVYHCIDEKDMDAAVLWKDAMICTDSWSYPINAPRVIGQPHPRSYGAFTTALERYVIQQQSLSWEAAINKMTLKPAQFFKLKGRGELREGYLADLVLFDPGRIKANATYLAPKQLSDGVEYLWVNGQKVIAQREMLDATPGRVLSNASGELAQA